MYMLFCQIISIHFVVRGLKRVRTSGAIRRQNGAKRKLAGVNLQN